MALGVMCGTEVSLDMCISHFSFLGEGECYLITWGTMENLSGFRGHCMVSAGRARKRSSRNICGLL